jgi:hypothetical protein
LPGLRFESGKVVLDEAPENGSQDTEFRRLAPRPSRRRGSDVKLKPAVQWGIVIFLIYFVVQNPSGAGNLIQGALNWVAQVGKTLGDTFHNLVAS